MVMLGRGRPKQLLCCCYWTPSFVDKSQEIYAVKSYRRNYLDCVALWSHNSFPSLQLGFCCSKAIEASCKILGFPYTVPSFSWLDEPRGSKKSHWPNGNRNPSQRILPAFPPCLLQGLWSCKVEGNAKTQSGGRLRSYDPSCVRDKPKRGSPKPERRMMESQLCP